MAHGNELKGRLAAGRRALGCILETGSPTVAEVMALAGYDGLMIDREHGPADLGDVVAMVRAIRTTPCAALVRVPANDPVELKRTLDIGVDGVMVPAIASAAEARAAVAACRYPPAGLRGMAASVVRASGYGFRTTEYLAGADAALLIICQIESAAAVERIAEIAAVDGADMLFIGPYDLSADLGHIGKPDHSDVAKAIAAVEAAVKRAGKLLGGIVTAGRDAAALFDAGYDLVLTGADVVLLREAARADVEAFRRAAGRA